MNVKVEDIRKTYTEGLKNYINNNDKAALDRAEDQSQQLLDEGLSGLSLILLHHDVLSEISEIDSNSLNQETIKKASEYLGKWMAPLEEKFQNYGDVIETLKSNNDRLREEIKTRKQVEQELTKSKNYFKSLIENVQDIITVLDLEGIIRFDTPSVRKILGYKKGELVGKDTFELIHANDEDTVRKVFNEIKDDPDRVVSVEFRFRHKEGHWVYLESIAKHIPDDPNGPVVVINSRDITKRKQRMRKLKESRAKLSEAQRIAKVGSWEWEPGHTLELNWSDEMCRICGISPENFDHSYDTYLNRIHPDDREKVKKNIEVALRDGKPFSFEHKIIRPDGKVRELLCRGRVEINGNGMARKLVGTGQDITEQKQREKKLRRYSERLRKLSERVERTREDERIRIAREIHDELGQMLTVLKMDVSTMRGGLKKKVSSEVLDYFNQEAEKILDRINTIIESVQRITTELRPEVLDDLGLIEALQWQAREFAKRSNLEISFSTKLDQTDFLSGEASTTLFRIFQEAMNNIIRHAQASKVEISLEKRNENLLFSIFDNGRGITQEQKEASSSFGIIGMKERTRFLGGDVFIEGSNGEGTRITMRIPVRGK